MSEAMLWSSSLFWAKADSDLGRPQIAGCGACETSAWLPSEHPSEPRVLFAMLRKGRGDRVEARPLFHSAIDALKVVEDLRMHGVALPSSVSAATFRATGDRSVPDDCPPPSRKPSATASASASDRRRPT
jgi:hypothetical protein